MTLKPLMKFAGPPPVLPGYTGPESIAGNWRGLSFIVTVDYDGQIEASLSRADKLRVTPGQSKSFFRMWGVTPMTGRNDMPISSHWVVKRGRVQ